MGDKAAPVVVLVIGLLLIYLGITGRAESMWKALTRPPS